MEGKGVERLLMGCFGAQVPELDIAEPELGMS